MMIDIGIMIALIILASAACKRFGCNTKSVPEEAEGRLGARMDQLERRLTDVQDVMIAIDEKLGRTQFDAARNLQG